MTAPCVARGPLTRVAGIGRAASSGVVPFAAVLALQGVTGCSVDRPPAGPRAWPASALPAPYPPSPAIEEVQWEVDRIRRFAPGSDLWPIAWASDDQLYTAWGDGGGFGGTNDRGRVSLGIARIAGDADDPRPTNVFGGHDALAPGTLLGKVHGVLAIDDRLYIDVSEQDGWMRSRVLASDDGGRSWAAGDDWTFDEPGGVFGAVAFLTYGRGYAGARDGYVYGYCEDVRGGFQPHIAMFRVPQDRIADRDAVEFFAGTGADGNPTWTRDVTLRQPVFSDPNGVGWGVQVVHHPGLDRYLLTVRHDDAGGWGIFDAPTPWGPWTTVAYYDAWLDSVPKFTFVFNQKWMSADGTRLDMVFSGSAEYDAFNVVPARLLLRDGR